jgi:hypothetical protein
MKKIVVYSPDARKLHEVEHNYKNFGELCDSLGLDPTAYKYVASYLNEDGTRAKMSLDLKSTELPYYDIDIFVFAKKNASGNLDKTLKELEDQVGFSKEDMTVIIKSILAILTEKMEASSDADKKVIMELIEDIKKELVI